MRFLLCFVVCIIIAASAYGQAGVIMISSDPAGTSCNLTDRTAGVCTYYIVHTETSGAAGSVFSAPIPACFSASWLSDTVVFPVTLGDSQTGASIAYGGCVSAPIHVLTMSFFCQGQTGNCCGYRILPHPNVESGEIEVSDCAFNVIYGAGGRAVINGTAGCPCGYASEASTWGKMKTLYEE